MGVRQQRSRQEFVDAIDWMIRDARQDRAKVERGIKPIQLSHVDQGVKRGRTLTAGFGTEEQAVFRPRETARSALSAALLSISGRPSST